MEHNTEDDGPSEEWPSRLCCSKGRTECRTSADIIGLDRMSKTASRKRDNDMLSQYITLGGTTQSNDSESKGMSGWEDGRSPRSKPLTTYIASSLTRYPAYHTPQPISTSTTTTTAIPKPTPSHLQPLPNYIYHIPTHKKTPQSRLKNGTAPPSEPR